MSARIWAVLAAAVLSSPPRALAERFAIDPSTGSFHVLLFKEGVLKALGHDHVVEVRGVKGEVELSASSPAVTLEIPSGELEIDLPQAREAEGVRARVSEGDRGKILQSMRGPKGLEVERHPLIRFVSTRAEPVPGPGRAWKVAGRLELHGAARELELRVALTERPGGYWAQGSVRLKPSDFGIAPFRAAAGLIKVRDEALVRFDLALIPARP